MRGFVKPLLLIILSGALSVPAYAQYAVKDSTADAVKRKMPKKPKAIQKEFSFGFRLNTDGWGFFVDRGRVAATGKNSDIFYDIKLIQVEFDEKKHPKEIKRTNTLGSVRTDKTKAFIYGKANNFYTFKIGYGKRKMIAGKPEQGTISVHWVYLGGLSAGLLKPYYINAYVPHGSGYSEESVRYTDTTKDIFLTKNNIIGATGFSKGLNEIKVIPGIHLKTGLHFDFAASKYSKMAVETGINAEFYIKKIEMMANQKAQPYFVNIYASIQFGRRR